MVEQGISFTPNKELKLLLKCIELEKNKSDEYQWEKELKGIDWDLFLELVQHHRVSSVVYKKLKSVSKRTLPQRIIKELQDQYQQTSFQMLKLSGELVKVCQEIATNYIDILVLKGPILALEIYGEFSMRPSRDLDLLVSIEDLKATEEVLFKLGYHKDIKDQEQEVFNIWRWRTHHFLYFHPVKQITIELHWRLHPPPSKAPNFKELWKRRRVRFISKTSVNYLGKEDLFLFLVTHGARHGWFRLRWLVDIDRLLKNSLDGEFIASLMKKYQYEYMVGQALILCNHLLKSPLPKRFESVLYKRKSGKLARSALFYIRQIVNLHGEQVSKETLRYHKKYARSLNPILYQLATYLLILYPSSSDIRTLPLPRALHFLYLPLRPCLTIWRAIKK